MYYFLLCLLFVSTVICNTVLENIFNALTVVTCTWFLVLTRRYIKDFVNPYNTIYDLHRNSYTIVDHRCIDAVSLEVDSFSQSNNSNVEASSVNVLCSWYCGSVREWREHGRLSEALQAPGEGKGGHTPQRTWENSSHTRCTYDFPSHSTTTITTTRTYNAIVGDTHNMISFLNFIPD